MKRIISYEGYLDDAKLGKCCAELFSNNEFLHNKAIPRAGIGNRPDCRCEELKLIVEFDGYQHCCQVDVIYKDRLKDAAYTHSGYHIVRIPYFVHLRSNVVNHYYGGGEMQIDFPYEFIADKGEKRHAEFCSLGIAIFIDDLYEIHFIQNEIICSLKNKINKYNGVQDCVLPLVKQCNNELKVLLESK